jgi:hypothetical protein
MKRSTLILGLVALLLLLVIGGGVSTLMQRSAGPGEVVVETAVTLEVEITEVVPDGTARAVFETGVATDEFQTMQALVEQCNAGDEQVCDHLRERGTGD